MRDRCRETSWLLCRRAVVVFAAAMLVLMGGYEGTAPTRAVSSWTQVAPLPVPLNSTGVAAGPDGRIYLTGGGVYGVDNSELDVYDPTYDQWFSGRDMPTKRSGVGVASANGRLYAFGGQVFGGAYPDVLNTVEAYDPISDTWTTVASMPTKRTTPAVAAGNDGRI
jgi:N-acetylneuraminic acid mutarotase